MWATEFSKGTIELQCVEVDPETVGQFTGLLDKNGMEIWEGDILKTEYGVNYSSKHYPSFKDETQLKGQIIVRFNPSQQSFNTQPPMDENFILSFEIIGNIYENPELWH